MVSAVAALYTPESIKDETTERTINIIKSTEKTVKKVKKKRVAAYCRVSTDKEAQLESLENQMEAFKYQLSIHNDWELVEIYSDDSTGTEIKGRQNFVRMINDCRAGKIDYILIKSISRFARNTLDCVRLVRELKEKGVYIYFEKEAIDTSDSASEMLLTIMASFAQEESRSISENTKWGIRKRFENGHQRKMPIYGYRHTDEEKYIIVPEKAEIVKEIFERIAHGDLRTEVLSDLNNRKIEPPSGDRWTIKHISSILHKEKYCGDVVYQKTYVKNHLNHIGVRNKGELPFIHVKNSHPAVIDRHIFVQAQQVLHMRHLRYGSASYPYGDRLKCPCCGKQLIHGRLYEKPFGVKKVHGGWGCYGEEGCREYLLLQQFLDGAVIDSYEDKYGERKERVDFYWIDDYMEEILLNKDNTVEIHWKDGDVTVKGIRFSEEKFSPSKASETWNTYINELKKGKICNSNKSLMGVKGM